MASVTRNDRTKPQSTFKEVDIYWRSFVRTAIPPGATDHQLSEMRKAFASVLASMKCCLASSLKPEALDVEALELWRKDTDKAFKEL